MTSSGLCTSTLLLLLGLLTALATLSAGDTLTTTTTLQPTISTTPLPSEELISQVERYREALKPIPGAFEALAEIYRNNPAGSPTQNLKRDETIVEYLSTMPKEVKNNLPVPVSFAQYGKKAQNELMSVYYAEKMSYRKKLQEIGKLVPNYPKPEIRFRVDVKLVGLDGEYVSSWAEKRDYLKVHRLVFKILKF